MGYFTQPIQLYLRPSLFPPSKGRSFRVLCRKPSIRRCFYFYNTQSAGYIHDKSDVCGFCRLCAYTCTYELFCATWRSEMIGKQGTKGGSAWVGRHPEICLESSENLRAGPTCILQRPLRVL